MSLRKVFSFPVLLGALLVGVVVIASRENLVDPDMWWHIATGHLILSTHHWPVADPFSFTAFGQHWIAYQWLGGVLIAWFAQLGGLTGLEILLALLSATLAVLVYWYATLRCRNSKAAFVSALVALMLSAGFFTARPQMLGYIFLVLLLICLEKYYQGRLQLLWIVPLIFLVWINTHSTFVLGFLALGLFWASGLVKVQCGSLESRRWTRQQSRHLLLVLLASVIALAITPYGTRLAAFPFCAMFSQPLNLANVAEWRGIGFGEAWGVQVLVLLLLFLAAQVALRAEYRLYELGLLLAATYLACVHRRFFLCFAIILIPMLSVLISRWIPAYSATSDHYALNAVILAAIAFGLIKSFPSRANLREMVRNTYPASGLGYLEAHPQRGPLFNEFVWGGYMIWKRPSQKVFIDGRVEVYTYEGVLADSVTATTLGPKALFILRKYGINSCLLTHDDPLNTLLASLPNWHCVYSDKTCVIYSRRNASTVSRAEKGSSLLRTNPSSATIFGRVANQRVARN